MSHVWKVTHSSRQVQLAASLPDQAHAGSSGKPFSVYAHLSPHLPHYRWAGSLLLWALVISKCFIFSSPWALAVCRCTGSASACGGPTRPETHARRHGRRSRIRRGPCSSVPWANHVFLPVTVPGAQKMNRQQRILWLKMSVVPRFEKPSWRLPLKSVGLYSCRVTVGHMTTAVKKE